MPDLAGWRRETLPAWPDSAFIATPPDWVCEILSPSTARVDRAEKLPLYGRFQVAYAWLIDPVARTLEVLELSGGRWTIRATHGPDETVPIPPFDAVVLATSDFLET